MTDPILIPDETCWAVEEAERFSVIVDAADYYRFAKQAMLKARHRVFLIGWDFDARIKLEPEEVTLEGPNRVGRFMEWLAQSRPDLDVRILKWDIGVLRSLGRGETPAFILHWLMPKGIDFRLDSAHPTTSAHHMKILIVDDALAFCGGIDMTMGRWDTRTHEERRPGRRSPRGKPMPPWHDVTTCVTGDAARGLARLAALRWYWATGEELDPVPEGEPHWPDGLVADFEGVPLGIARTLPRYEERGHVNEILGATYAVIRSAERFLYIESQYLASRRICEVLMERLAEPDGPEIVVINPDTADGWLEAKAMDTARVRMIRMLREANIHNRFRIYYPVNASGTPIYVHAKIMFADDRALKVGSANINNRSMGYDSECDLVIDAEHHPERRASVVRVRDGLLAEHLGCSPAEVADALERSGGSLMGAIDELNRPDRKHLVPLRARELTLAEELFAESDAADPIRPVGIRRIVYSLMRRAPVRQIRQFRRRRIEARNARTRTIE
ncbi:phospholipase D-like domain-containing protein [Acuticoccus sediminis]|uniref:phospholipase D-like domain-containing protein n=1 Tax=Acuticoccus sediminis TaxID=2184697 RepID=UPI001CFEDF57|nr:phospholipase D-like domain-containing protein [Acuticoccus sediminis]